jgi:hypothetical protein
MTPMPNLERSGLDVCALPLAGLGVARPRTVIRLLDLSVGLGHDDLRRNACGQANPEPAAERAGHLSEPEPHANRATQACGSRQPGSMRWKALLTGLALMVSWGPAAAQEASAAPVIEENEQVENSAGPSEQDSAAKPKAEASPARQPVGREHKLAQQFSKLFQEALTLESTVQSYERKTLGSETMDRLGGIMLKRRERIDRDLLDYESQLDRIANEPLTIPTAPEDNNLTIKERLALDSLRIAYGDSRDSLELENYISANQAFLSTLDWGDRDQAVRIREALLAQEASFQRLVVEAQEILKGGKRSIEVEAMVVNLRRMAPSLAFRKKTASSLVLNNESIRAEALQEALDFLQSPTPEHAPREGSDALLKKLPELQSDLIQASALVELRAELSSVEAELAEIETRLEDLGVNSLSDDARKQQSARANELRVRESTLQAQWLNTPPAQPQLNDLIRVQDGILQCSMLELGARGVLFAHRYDSLSMKKEERLETPFGTWRFLEEQAELIGLMDEARPELDPLYGLPPRLDPSFQQSQLELVLALKKTRPDLFKRLPEPKKSVSIPLQSKAASGTTPLGSVGAPPPGASSGKKKGKKKKR